ncbi:MAG: putative fucose-binding lectin protein [Alphaproteobacteria bacterium]|nr:putative fucose-binding lectin protein [Alphaproteobacteria bacterium]MDB5720502.1 putative fucose-binding lectin protein [Alphaproteobacteria bacterium]
MADMPSIPIGTASISWIDSGGALHIRVYSTDGYNVIERCLDTGGTWYEGAFSAPGAQVSAVCWQTNAGVSIRVYCAFEDDVTEWCTDPGVAWYKGSYTTQ